MICNSQSNTEQAVDDRVGKVKKLNKTCDIISAEIIFVEKNLQFLVSSEQRSIEWKLRAFKFSLRRSELSLSKKTLERVRRY